MGFWTCRRVRGIMAQAAYEELSRDAHQFLKGHIDACPACRELSASFSRVANAPRPEPAAFEHDLLPAIRARLREDASLKPRFGEWRLTAVGLAVAATALLSVAVWQIKNQSSGAPVIQTATRPVQEAMEKANALAADGDFSAAYTLLRGSIDRYPDDPETPEALQLASDIAFDELELYEAAYRGYETLQQQYRSVFNAEGRRERNQFRWNLLAESRGDDARFEPLHALNRAQGNFEELERIVSRHPVAYVASLATDQMAGILMEQEGLDDRVAAMEKARDQCTDPVAMARLNIELGDLLRGDAGGTERARGIYREVAQGQHEALARLARESLEELDAAARR